MRAEDIIVRMATEADKERLIELMFEFGEYTRETFLRPVKKHYLMDYVVERESIEQDLAKYMMGDLTLFLVAEVGGKIAGFLSGDVKIERQMNFSRQGRIHNFFVTWEMRGQGIGREHLWTKAMEWYREKKCNYVTLEAYEGSPAIKFYKERGFETTQLIMVNTLLNWEVMEVTPEDARAMVEANLQVWHDTYVNEAMGITDAYIDEVRGYRMSEQFVEEYAAKLEEEKLDPQGRFRMLAKDDSGRVVGTIRAKRYTDQSVELNSVYVRREYWGTGLGTELMKTFLEWAGNVEIKATVVSHNKRTMQFFERFDFKLVPGSEGFAPFAKLFPTVELRRERQKQ
jgi:GNAT superfamily N-acetyltransferase